MRVPFIAGNWKMNTNVTEACDLVHHMQGALEAIPGVEKVICPPFISIHVLFTLLENSSIKLGAQNLYFEEKGAFTGEISPLMLSGLCQYVILGHSERRHIFGETHEVINKKVKAAIKAGLIPILCVGELQEEKEAGQAHTVIARQLEFALSGLAHTNGLLIAYEPVWAIGTGKAAGGKQANETMGFIRDMLVRIFNPIEAQSTRILYGGSINAVNIAEFIREPEIDGALVGGASLKAEEFVSIVNTTSQIKTCS